jgi:hypothetical protein
MSAEPESGSCPLCQSAAELRRVEEGLWVVEYAECRRFTIDDDLLAVLRNPTARQGARVRDLLRLLSTEAAATWAEGGRLNITVENWRAAAHKNARDTYLSGRTQSLRAIAHVNNFWIEHPAATGVYFSRKHLNINQYRRHVLSLS